MCICPERTDISNGLLAASRGLKDHSILCQSNQSTRPFPPPTLTLRYLEGDRLRVQEHCTILHFNSSSFSLQQNIPLSIHSKSISTLPPHISSFCSPVTMKHFRGLTFAALSLLAAVAFAEDVVAPADPDVPSDVKVLQTDTFDSFMNDNPLVLAECKFIACHLIALHVLAYVPEGRLYNFVLTNCSLCTVVWSLQGPCSRI